MWQEGNVCFGTDEICGLVQVSDSQKNMISELKGNVAFHSVRLSVHGTTWRKFSFPGKLHMVGRHREPAPC